MSGGGDASRLFSRQDWFSVTATAQHPSVAFRINRLNSWHGISPNTQAMVIRKCLQNSCKGNGGKVLNLKFVDFCIQDFSQLDDLLGDLTYFQSSLAQVVGTVTASDLSHRRMLKQWVQ